MAIINQREMERGIMNIQREFDILGAVISPIINNDIRREREIINRESRINFKR